MFRDFENDWLEEPSLRQRAALGLTKKVVRLVQELGFSKAHVRIRLDRPIASNKKYRKVLLATLPDGSGLLLVICAPRQRQQMRVFCSIEVTSKLKKGLLSEFQRRNIRSDTQPLTRS